MTDVPDGHLYLGEHVDESSRDRNGEPVFLDADDLTTHGVIVGMTGSGKTGLGVICVEEALLQGIPTLVLDPKGDLGVLLLNFPDLEPDDFAPWVEDEDPGEVATRWKQGLSDWGIDSDRLAALRDAAEFTIYTPGSTSGVPLNIVGDLGRPDTDADPELVRDEIEGYVSGLLNLVGIESDPLAGKEHILLSNLIEHAWSSGNDLDLPGLVAQVENPPVRKLGVYETDAFYPAKERTKLAMTLNGLLASSAFAAWKEGPDLNLDSLLTATDGERPACAIISLAHLTDEERQFVVSLILGKLITWKREQAGTSKLRTMLYFDEVMGFVPPQGMPPAKKPLLTLFKQARAFGLGVVLATQNPVDVDYKGLSNAGTWMIGRLQTEQDQSRLLDGLSTAGGEVDVKAVADTIGGLEKREFVLRTPDSATPSLFTTRWAMSYLRGPLTRQQISTLMASHRSAVVGEVGVTGAGEEAAELEVEPEPAEAEVEGEDESQVEVEVKPQAEAEVEGGETTSMPPQVADGVVVRWLDPTASWAAEVGAAAGGTTLAPSLLARAEVTFDDSKLDLRHSEPWDAVYFPLGPSFDATAATVVNFDEGGLHPEAPDGASYVLSDAPLSTKTFFSGAEKAIADHLYRNSTYKVLRNSHLKLTARGGESAEEFAARCKLAVADAAEDEHAKVNKRFEKRIGKARDALVAASDKMDQAAAAVGAEQGSAMVRGVTSVLGAVLGGKRDVGKLARDIGKAAGGDSAAARRVEAARDDVRKKQEALEELERDLAADLAEVQGELESKAGDIETVDVRPRKSDVRVTGLNLVWLPVS